MHICRVTAAFFFRHLSTSFGGWGDSRKYRHNTGVQLVCFKWLWDWQNIPSPPAGPYGRRLCIHCVNETVSSHPTQLPVSRRGPVQYVCTHTHTETRAQTGSTQKLTRTFEGNPLILTHTSCLQQQPKMFTGAEFNSIQFNSAQFSCTSAWQRNKCMVLQVCSSLELPG